MIRYFGFQFFVSYTWHIVNTLNLRASSETKLIPGVGQLPQLESNDRLFREKYIPQDLLGGNRVNSVQTKSMFTAHIRCGFLVYNSREFTNEEYIDI